MSLATDILLACAAGMTLAWLVARAAWRFVALPRVEQALLVVAVGVMTVCAQKSGSNVVSNAEIMEEGRRGEEKTAVSNVEAESLRFGIEDNTSSFEAVGRPLPPSEDASVTSDTSVLRAKTPLTSSSANPCESVQSVALTTSDLVRGFALTRVGTNEVFDFSAPEVANYATSWMLHGGATARTHLRFDDWTFPFGDACLTNLTAFMFGVIAPDLYNEEKRIAPLQASLGFVAGGLDFVNAEILENGRRGEEDASQSGSGRETASTFGRFLRVSQLPTDAVLTNAYVIAAPGVGEPFVLWECFFSAEI